MPKKVWDFRHKLVSVVWTFFPIFFLDIFFQKLTIRDGVLTGGLGRPQYRGEERRGQDGGEEGETGEAGRAVRDGARLVEHHHLRL